MSLLELSGVTAGYGKIPIVREIDLTVEKGETLAVIGPNGSGKSTLALIGIHVPFDISYVRYALTGALIVVFLLYRPRGLIEERPVKTPLYEVLSGRRKAQKLRIGR